MKEIRVTKIIFSEEIPKKFKDFLLSGYSPYQPGDIRGFCDVMAFGYCILPINTRPRVVIDTCLINDNQQSQKKFGYSNINFITQKITNTFIHELCHYFGKAEEPSIKFITQKIWKYKNKTKSRKNKNKCQRKKLKLFSIQKGS